MIRINLLPARKRKGTETVQQQLLAFAAVLVLAIVACFVWWALKAKEADGRAETKKAKEQELAQLDKIIGEVNEFTTKKKELEEKLQVIQSLKKGKTGPVRALDDLATEVPNRVWLSKIEEVSGRMIFEGNAIDHEDVSAFMKALQKSKYFTGVVLGYSRSAKSSKVGVSFYEFKITCAVNYSA
ncbi:MAG: PilN domain-containing protein [Deltaproteobacteria bacterium]|nr:PilN domain-containing protein [Deltaproteobacteria bacterium]